jgi:hypothetical protein
MKIYGNFLNSIQIPFLTLIAILTLLSSCVKDERNCVASRGKGGLTVKVFPVYQGQPVPSSKTFKDTVYVKYGATSFPGYSLTKYQLKVVVPFQENSVNVTKLNCGAYYFLVVCQDPVTGNRLRGGATFNSDKISGNFNLVIPVYSE